MNSKRFAPIVAVALILSVAAPAFASTGEEGMTVGVSQTDGVVVTVTSNGTAVENASVSVEALNNSTYAGAGSYTTDANGTVSLPTPANNTTVEVVATKGNVSDSTTVELIAAEEEEETGDDAFGQRVSAFVHKLLSGEDVKNPGRVISDWVTMNNPGADKKPDHAGPNDDEKKGNEKGDDHPGNHGNDKNDKNDEDDEDDSKKGNGKKNGKNKGNGNDH